MFNNLGRQIVDSAVTYMSRGVLKKKKKDLLRIMEKEGDNTPYYLMGVARRMHEMHSFEKNKSGFAVAFDYKRATHYYVSSLPKAIAVTNIFSGNIVNCLNTFNDIFTIESTVPGVDIFAQFCNLEEDKFSDGVISINGEPMAWSISVFVNPMEESIGLVHYPLFYCYVGKNGRSLFFITNEYHPMSCAFDTSPATFQIDDVSCTVKLIDILDKQSELVKAVFSHLTNCLAYTYSEISSSKLNKTEAEAASEFIADFFTKAISGDLDKPVHTEKSDRAISVAHEGKVEVEVEDKLVPLNRYIREYVPTVRRKSKGGHHASPIPHDRRGYYRRSRGSGDWDYVNGEFVFVGDKKGKYSYVTATHVGGEKVTKQKPTLIYKV